LRDDPIIRNANVWTVACLWSSARDGKTGHLPPHEVAVLLLLERIGWANVCTQLGGDSVACDPGMVRALFEDSIKQIISDGFHGRVGDSIRALVPRLLDLGPRAQPLPPKIAAFDFDLGTEKECLVDSEGLVFDCRTSAWVGIWLPEKQVLASLEECAAYCKDGLFEHGGTQYRLNASGAVFNLSSSELVAMWDADLSSIVPLSADFFPFTSRMQEEEEVWDLEDEEEDQDEDVEECAIAWRE